METVRDGKGKQEEMLGNGEKIKRYLRNISPALLEVQNIDSIEILEMRSGSYNLNFHVRVNQKEFIFRINIEQQSGLAKQIEYEFMVMKFLESHRIAPKAYYFDDSQERFDFPIMIEEYLEGPILSLEKEDFSEDLSKVAELMVRLHSLEPGDRPFITWKDPLTDTYELARSDLIGLEAKRTSEKKTISLAKKLLEKTEAMVLKHRHLFHADSLNHTDLCCENFIKTAQGLRLIDWEKPRVDDYSYDICCFLSEPAELYNSQKVLNSEERMNFLDNYARLSGKNPDHLMEKVKIREPLISLHWILWGATMLCDLKDRHTSPELLEAHKEKIVRYERIAKPENIEKLLESL
jgi:thiamine kinase-like enzyme